MTPQATTALRIVLTAGLAGACGAAPQDDALRGSPSGSCAAIAPSYAASPAALAAAAHAMIEGTVDSVVAEWEPLHLNNGAPVALSECEHGAPMLRITLSDVVSLRGAAVPDTVTVLLGSLWPLAVHNRGGGSSEPRLEVGDTAASPLLTQANFLVQGQTVGFFVESRDADASYLVAPTAHASPYVVDDDVVIWVPLTFDGNAHRPSCGGPYVDFDAVAGMNREAAHSYFRDEPAPNPARRDLRAIIDHAASSTDAQHPRCESLVAPSSSSEDSGR